MNIENNEKIAKIDDEIIELVNNENRHTNKNACRVFDLLVEKADLIEK